MARVGGALAFGFLHLRDGVVMARSDGSAGGVDETVSGAVEAAVGAAAVGVVVGHAVSVACFSCQI